jgi:hypothetical protein
MRSKIIFLLGEARVGKDTVGAEFVNHGYSRVAFADAVRLEYSKLNNVPIEHLMNQGPEKEKHRPGIITLAERERAIDPEVWINKAFEPFIENGVFKPETKLVVTDMRRISEVLWYIERKKEAFFINHNIDFGLFHVTRKGIEDTDHLTHYAIGYAKGYSSATAYIGGPLIDGTIENNVSTEELKRKVQNIISFYNL